jgi:hypothetical protein
LYFQDEGAEVSIAAAILLPSGEIGQRFAGDIRDRRHRNPAAGRGSRLRFSLDDLVPTLFERRALPVLNQEVVDRPSAIER